MAKVVLFTTPTCPTCRAEKTWLAQKGIAFEEYNLEDVEVQEELRALQHRVKRRLEHVPITVINGQVYEGFDPDAMEEILG
jgi:glutaredoxin